MNLLFSYYKQQNDKRKLKKKKKTKENDDTKPFYQWDASVLCV